MPEKGKTTAFQFFCLVSVFLFGSTTIMMSLTAAGRDSWISMVLAGAGGMVLVLVITGLAVSFPGLTIIEYIPKIFGAFPGKLIGLLYLWYFLHLGSLVLRNYGELMSTVVMPETAPGVFHVSLAIVIAYLVYHRVEVMGRLSELVFPLSIGVTILTSLLIILSGVTDLRNILPVFEHGIKKVILGSITLAGFPYLETILFAMIFPYINSADKGKKAFLAAVIISWIALLMIMIQNITIFGDHIITLTFPRFYSIRLISIGNFIERIEPVILGVWIMGGVVKAGICLYAFGLGAAQVLGLKDFRSLILPAALIMAAMADLLFKNTFEMQRFAVDIYPFYAFPFQFALPLLMLVIARLRRRKSG